MNIDDFRYMYRGKVVATLKPEDASLLASFEREGQQKNRALLLLHGFSSSPAVYRRIIPALEMYDAVLCPALPGHGNSIAAFSTVLAKDWVDCATRSCERLQSSYAQVDVMGMSLGGLLACHLSTLFPLNHLYLLAPALSLRGNIPLVLMLTRSLHALGLRNIRNRAGNLCSATYPELAYRKMPLSAIIQILTLIQAFKLKLPTCPTDLFLGRHDEVVHSSNVMRLFTESPHTNIHWLNNSAHVLPLDNDIDTIVACLTNNAAL